ncbi:VPS18 [Scenedesmus sp. PABB004]|nr:VPS18 [Scenedesmus sp. PABB004]
MDLLDDFNSVRQTFAELGELGGAALGDDSPELAPPPAACDLPSLSIEASVRQAARGRGQVVAAAAAADTVLLATSRGFLLRYQWDETGSERGAAPRQSARHHGISRCCGACLLQRGPQQRLSRRQPRLAPQRAATPPRRSPPRRAVTEVEAVRGADARVRSLWVDPRGRHVLLGVKTSSHVELLYWHSSWTKPRPLGKLKGLAVSAVGWQKQPAGGGGGQEPEAEDELALATGDVLLGSESGSLHVTAQDARVKKEGASTLLLDFKDKRKAITAVEQEVLPGGRRLVLLATPSALFVAVGGPGLQGALARFAPGGASWEPLLEVVSPSMHSTLRLLRGAGDVGALPGRFAWLVGGMLLHGHLLLDELAGDASVDDGGELVGDMRQLALAGAGGSPEDEPHDLAVSEHHYLVLYADRLAAVNQVSGRVAAEVAWGPGSHVAGLIGTPLGLLQDPAGGGVSLWSGEALHDVALANEGRDMWRIYLAHQDYANALKLAAGAAQRDAVYRAMGDAAAAAGDWAAAGARYGRIVGGAPPFEELALTLVESGAPDALTAFLTTKLQVLAPGDKAQATMVASWLTELLLDQINADLLAGGGQHTPAYTQHVAQLRSFLSERADTLNWGTTTALLESYGRLEELEAFAAAKGDQEALLEYLMRHPGGAVRALGVLRKPSVGPALVYKCAPELLAAAPGETVDLLISAGASLDPRALLPALVRFAEPGTPRARREEALRYISFAIDQLQCDDRRQACVRLLCELGLFEDAVGLALGGDGGRCDLALAQAVASAPEDDDGLRRKLWLAIAKHVVQGGERGDDAHGGGGGGDDAAPGGDQAARIKLAVEFLKEAGGLLVIEDVLPFFPDFVTIDNFKGAITDSLDRYSRQIEALKGEMDEATEIAEAVRRDLRLLGSRAAVVSSRQTCAACGRAILDPPPNPRGLPDGGAVPPFYLFPTGQAFHILCAAGEVVAYGGEARAGRVRKLLGKLARAEPAPPGGQACGEAGGGGGGGGGGKARLRGGAGGSERGGGRDGAGAGTGGGGGVAALAARLEEEVGGEDPWNGELLARVIDMPFVQPDGEAEEGPRVLGVKPALTTTMATADALPAQAVAAPGLSKAAADAPAFPAAAASSGNSADTGAHHLAAGAHASTSTSRQATAPALAAPASPPSPPAAAPAAEPAAVELPPLAPPTPPGADEPPAVHAEYAAYLARFEAGDTLAQRWHRLAAAGRLQGVRQEWDDWQHDLLLLQLQAQLAGGRGKRRRQDEAAEADADAPASSPHRPAPARAPADAQPARAQRPAGLSAGGPGGPGGGAASPGSREATPGGHAAAHAAGGGEPASDDDGSYSEGAEHEPHARPARGAARARGAAGARARAPRGQAARARPRRRPPRRSRQRGGAGPRGSSSRPPRCWAPA